MTPAFGTEPRGGNQRSRAATRQITALLQLLVTLAPTCALLRDVAVPDDT